MIALVLVWTLVAHRRADAAQSSSSGAGCPYRNFTGRRAARNKCAASRSDTN
jgi:hypothetical protein